MDYYEKEWRDVVLELRSNADSGLSSAEAEVRLKRYGSNELKKEKKVSALAIFLSQFKGFFIIILVIASILAYLVGEKVNAIAILVVVVINSILGFFQEYRAEKSIEALRKMASLTADVLRDGREAEIETKHIVPGDIVVVYEGQKVPADCRLIECSGLEVSEAMLTGESVPVKKTSVSLSEKEIAERKNMLYSGTAVTKGHGKAVVVDTGMKTEIGKIAGLIEKAPEEETHLQKKLRELAFVMGIATVAICIFVFIAGLLQIEGFWQHLFDHKLLDLLAGKDAVELLITAISLAVAAIPEGLPVVVTITLAFGVKNMIKKDALIRRLPAVETLGCVTVICTDKTGTLTKNQMTVKKVYANERYIDVTGAGYDPVGSFSCDPRELQMLMLIGALNNDSELTPKHEVIGDPTEGALIVSAIKASLDHKQLLHDHPRLEEVPFDSDRKMMTTVHEIGGKKFVLVKGAPDVVLRLCTKMLINGKVRQLTAEDARKIAQANEEFARQALRVLAFAYRPIAGKLIETDLIFTGLQGMIDPPREGVKEAIQKCHEAGIRVVMITGDYKGTAVAIARDLGIPGGVMTGEELEKIGESGSSISHIGIFARIDARHKMKIIELLKKSGSIVSMTGDGVNDAPALKDADMGVAMGSGTDVAKEASQMIITDDHFSSIVDAVEEGRHIYNNLKKFLRFQLSTNLGAILIVLFASTLGLPLPLTALHLLWINVIVDGPPALSLGFERSDSKIMKKPPRDPKERVLSRSNLNYILYVGVLLFVMVLVVYYFVLQSFGLERARTVAFTSFVLFQMFNVMSCRSRDESLFKIGLFSNRPLVITVLLSAAVQLLIVYLPFLQRVFGTVSLGLFDWLLVLAAASSVLVATEIVKMAG